MKTRRLIFIFAALSLAAVCYARIERWPVTQKPAVTLAQAEAFGDKKIAEKYKGYFCVGARFASLGDVEQEWELAYTNTKGERKWVVIDGKGKATLHEALRVL